jgi:hypothetical protein
LLCPIASGASCHNRTNAVQQTLYSITSSARATLT